MPDNGGLLRDETGGLRLGRWSAIVTVTRFEPYSRCTVAPSGSAERGGAELTAASQRIAARETRNADGALRWTSGPPVPRWGRERSLFPAPAGHEQE
ncbi:hypothetical protein GCM10009848_47940 [Micromonospora lupini]